MKDGKTLKQLLLEQNETFIEENLAALKERNLVAGVGKVHSTKRDTTFEIECSLCLMAKKTPEHVAVNGEIRRLTPLEYCRLQGFPDDYLEGCERSEAKEYIMWGNGITLPIAEFILGGLAK